METKAAVPSTVESAEEAAVEPAVAPSGEGTVVVDIGGSRGAVIVFTPESLVDAEIEIRPAGAAWDGTHTGIRRRDLRDAVAHAGVFGSLEAGRYQVRLRGVSTDRPDAGVVVDLTVVGGEITQLEWPGS
jgi:hypothetical protein